jgi:heptosyltransferase-2
MPSAKPILIVPYMWIGDFVRCHTVVKILMGRNPAAQIDMLTTSMVAPLLDYLPGVRKGIVTDLPRKRLALGQHVALADRLRAEGYGQALIMPRTWKSALAPCLAGIPVRTGFLGEVRIGLINDLRLGERRLPRMVDRCAALARAKDERAAGSLPLPELKVPAAEIASWRERLGLADSSRSIVALAPGAVGPSKRWPTKHYAAVAGHLADEGHSVWIVGGPQEKGIAGEIVGARSGIHDLTGPDLRNAILALATAQAAVSNDSGLLHVAAALGTPSIGIFGPTSPWHWAPLNPVSAIIETHADLACRPCHRPVCRLGHHRCMQEISPAQVVVAVRRAIGAAQREADLGVARHPRFRART